MTEIPASAPASPDAAAPAERSIAPDAVYLAGPKRIQGTPFWIEAVDVLRQRFAEHRVIVAGDGTFRRYKPVPIRELQALVLIVPPDGLVGFGSYVETSNAVRFKHPTWAFIGGELHSGFALHVNDTESLLLFGRVEPAIDGTVSDPRDVPSPIDQHQFPGHRNGHRPSPESPDALTSSATTVGREMIDSCRDKLSPEAALVVSDFLLAGESTCGFYDRELMRRCPHNGPFFEDDDYVVCEPCGKAFKPRADRPVVDPCPNRLSSAEAFVVGKFLRSYCEDENAVGDELGEFGELMRRCPHVSYANSIDGSLLYVCHVCGKVFEEYDDFDFSLIIFNGEFLPESLQKCSKCGRRSHEHGMYRKGERVAFLTGSECVL